MSWEDNVRKVVPYTPGEQPKSEGIIKLNTNECPYPPAPGVKRILEEENYKDLRLYPEADTGSLVKCLAEYYKLSPKQVFVGVGSDDVISVAFLTFFNSGKPVFFPDVTYSFYPVWADVYKIPYETKALDQNFHIVKEDYIAPNGGIIIPNPNAPTGLLESRETLEYIIKNNPDSIVMIDEAYVDFAGDDASVLPLLDKYENLLVIRTFSKSRAMAGVRIGFAMGSEKLIKYINDVKYSINSYTMNTPSLLLGAEAVRDDAYFKDTLAKIINTREWMKKELKALGFTFGDSKSNFVFAKHETKNAKDIFEFLKTKGIYVRYFDAPRTKDYLRITIGTDEEAQILINTLKVYLN